MIRRCETDRRAPGPTLCGACLIGLALLTSCAQSRTPPTTERNGASPHLLEVLRVLPNGHGSEVVFSVFRRPGTSDAKFAEDAKWIEKDLRALRTVLGG
jgi:hypothetical protein